MFTRYRQLIEARRDASRRGVAGAAGLSPDGKTARDDRHFIRNDSGNPFDSSVTGGVWVVLKRKNAQEAGQFRSEDFAGGHGLRTVPVLKVESQNPNAGQSHEIS